MNNQLSTFSWMAVASILSHLFHLVLWFLSNYFKVNYTYYNTNSHYSSMHLSKEKKMKEHFSV